jgi:uncharacterized protein
VSSGTDQLCPVSINSTAGIGRPIASAERLTLIDSLRGAALFGVLLINMLWFAGEQNAATAAQFAQLPTARLDAIVAELIDVFVFAKSIGIFAFLFGFGFALQAERLGARGADTRAVLGRRLVGLLVIGLAHWCLWSGDILHIYAVAGFLLIPLCGWSNTRLLAVGVPLAIVARPATTFVAAQLGAPPGAFGSQLDAELSARLHVFQSPDFLAYMCLQLREDVLPSLLDGSYIGGVLHALARFMVGMAVARGAYLRKVPEHIRVVAMVSAISLLLGVVFQREWLFEEWLRAAGLSSSAALRVALAVLNSFGVVAMTAGYVALFALTWQAAAGRRVLASLGPVGKMALTSYLAQTLVNYVIFFGIGFALVARVGTTFCVVASTVVFSLQAVASRYWLDRFRFGPVEWLWRWWTYGKRPPMRLRARAATV